MDKSLPINLPAPDLPKNPNLLNVARTPPSLSLLRPSSSNLKPDNNLLNPMQKPQQLGSATGKPLLFPNDLCRKLIEAHNMFHFNHSTQKQLRFHLLLLDTH